MNNQIEDIRNYWIQRLAECKTDGQKKIIEHKIRQVEAQMCIAEVKQESPKQTFAEEAEEKRVIVYGSQKQEEPKKEEVEPEQDDLPNMTVEEMENMLVKLQRQYNKYPSEDMLENIQYMKEAIGKKSYRIAVQNKNSHKYFSEILQKSFVFDAESESAIYEDGVIYTAEEMGQMLIYEDYPKAVEVNHKIKLMFHAKYVGEDLSCLEIIKED